MQRWGRAPPPRGIPAEWGVGSFGATSPPARLLPGRVLQEFGADRSPFGPLALVGAGVAMPRCRPVTVAVVLLDVGLSTCTLAVPSACPLLMPPCWTQSGLCTLAGQVCPVRPFPFKMHPKRVE